MKKPLLTVLTLLTSSLCIWADPVDRAKAKEIATAYSVEINPLNL